MLLFYKFSFLTPLFFPVKNKFGLPEEAELHIFDDSDTAVEEDVLFELIESNPGMCLTVCDSLSDGMFW